jgi:hypothetical protein
MKRQKVRLKKKGWPKGKPRGKRVAKECAPAQAEVKQVGGEGVGSLEAEQNIVASPPSQFLPQKPSGEQCVPCDSPLCPEDARCEVVCGRVVCPIDSACAVVSGHDSVVVYEKHLGSDLPNGSDTALLGVTGCSGHAGVDGTDSGDPVGTQRVAGISLLSLSESLGISVGTLVNFYPFIAGYTHISVEMLRIVLGKLRVSESELHEVVVVGEPPFREGVALGIRLANQRLRYFQDDAGEAFLGVIRPESVRTGERVVFRVVDGKWMAWRPL